MKSVAIGASLALVAAQKPEQYYQDKFVQYIKDFNKDYSANGEDVQTRYKAFKTNVDIIDETNGDKSKSYWLGLNEFADLTWEEFSATHLGYKEGPRFGDLPKVPFPNITDVADSVDWVAKGAVTKVKNQQRCGSCWAFSTTGSLEGAYFVASGKLESLSEEDLVQCDHNGDQGCKGGLMDNAFSWISQHGICSEDSYPYTSGGGVTGTCKKSCTPSVTLTGHTDVPSKDEKALKAAVSKQPVSVAIEADKSAFQLYAGGVLDNPACGTQLDHGVLVVGYGTDDGKDYWKVKNSWGATWGEKGYLRMVRNKNQCGIAQQPSYPTGAKAAKAETEFVRGGNLKLSWTDCGAKHGKVSGLSPDTLTLGTQTSVTGTGSLDEDVTGGSFTIDVKASVISKHFTGDLCQPKTFDITAPFIGTIGTLTWDGLKCPVKAGDVSVPTELKLSGSLPASMAKATISIKGTATNGDDLLCLTINAAPAASDVVV